MTYAAAVRAQLAQAGLDPASAEPRRSQVIAGA